MKRTYNSQSKANADSPLQRGIEQEYSSEAFAKLDEQTQLHVYAKACEQKLGAIPKINCHAGLEVPVGITRPDGFLPHGQKQSDYNGSWNDERTCDRPSFLLSAISSSGSCAPYSRVGRIKPQQGFSTEWVFVCRRYFDRPAASTRYDDVNLIGYDRSTGATCFFNSKVNEEPPKSEATDKAVDVAMIPEVAAPDSLKFYQSLKLNASEARCVSCHAAHPWLRTPYLQQVKWGDEPVVPAMSTKDPYYLVASNYMEAVHNQKWAPQFLNSPEAKVCSRCHRIGGDVYASYIAPAAVGIREGLKGQEDKHFPPKFSDHMKAFPNNLHFELGRNLFMPPKNEEEWNNSRQKKAADFILKCGRDSGEECLWQTGEIPSKRSQE